MILSQVGIKGTSDKLSLSLSEESDAVFDVGPAYGISQNITDDIAKIIKKLKGTIVKHIKLSIIYHGLSSGASNRIIHPYKLIHTPISWYLVACCENAN